MDIGINYITELDGCKNRYDEIYKFLIEKGYINTLKFPGKYCDYDSLRYFLNIVKGTHSKRDIHGIPQMIPAIHSKKCTENIEWEKFISEIGQCDRISTHLGIENKEILENYVAGTYEKNLTKLKENLKCEVGIENIPGGFLFDKRTLTPEFLTNAWEKADFGVFDISHAKLAAKDLGITYDEYLKNLKYKEKVKILHISGNIIEIGERKNAPDKHVLISRTEIKDIIGLLYEFTNVDLIISEYGFNSKYSYEKEIVIESILLNYIVKTRNEEQCIEIFEFLEQNLKSDISNLEELLERRKI